MNPKTLNVWDGNEWQQIGGDPGQSGPTIPMLRGDFADHGTITTPTSSTVNAWVQAHAGLPYDIIIYGMSDLNGTQSTVYEVGTGPLGSEVTRAINNHNLRPNGDLDYGVFVPAGTRIVTRRNNTNWRPQALLYTKTGKPGKQAEAGIISKVVGLTWDEVAAAPPLVDGVWITSLRTNGIGEYGFGSAGNEVSFVNTNLYYRHPPIWWPPATRLAAKFTNYGTAYVQWREHLD